MDITPIAARLSIIAKNMQLLKEASNISRDEFLQDNVLQNAIEHEFQVTIQAALDIGSLILADRSASIPEEYRDIFPKLAEMGVISQELAIKLVGMAKFCNVLVHMYIDVDLEKVYQYLQNNLGDLETFTRQVGIYMSGDR